MLKLPNLPYAYDALEPALSSEIMFLHHDKHHATYIENTNRLLADTESKAKSLEDVVRNAGKSGKMKLFNQAAQVWNHALFWNSMAPSKQAPNKTLAAAIHSNFGSMDQLREKFINEGVNHFASGWVWLIAHRSGLSVASSHDSDNTIAFAHEAVALLVCDLWEHAYYIDYKYARKKYLEAWFDNVVNWDFAAAQYDAANNSLRGWCFDAY